MLKPYEKYQNTEYDWLGLIPLHWQWLYLSQTCTEKKQIKNTGNIEKKVLSLSYGKIVPRKNVDLGLAPKDYSSYQIVDKNDIILRLTDLQNDKKSLRTGLVKERGIITSAYTCLKPFQNAAYLQYLLHSYDTQKVFYGMGGGVRQSIGYKDIRNIRIPFPPREEQDKIVRYLDWKLSKINKLIRAKKKQIALLNEQRQVIIHNAVTKGVDPNVMMKDSGIEWISKIPTSWKKDKITRLFNIIGSGTTPSSGNSIYYENPTTPWINSGDLYSDTMYLSNTNKSVSQRAIDDYSVLKIYPSNTIVIAMYGASIGNLAITEIPACCNQACCCLSEIDQRLDIKYAYYLLKACKSFWIEKSKGGGQPNISQDIIKQTWLPLPPKTEQIKISQFLSYYESHFHRAIETIKHEIILIQEFRTRLISDVVTGKVDVRDIEIPEYEADSDETIDDEIDDNLVLDEEDGEMEVE